MPQFELTFYLSQAFWMLLSFGLLFFVMSVIIFPAFEDIFSKRRKMIDGNLEKAERLNERAEQLMRDYNDFMLNAEQEKANRVKAANAEIAQADAEAEAANEKRLRRMIQATEADVRVRRKQLEADSETIAEQLAARLVDRILPADSKKKGTV